VKGRPGNYPNSSGQAKSLAVTAITKSAQRAQPRIPAASSASAIEESDSGDPS
jgi:hypothetical protein